jgi:alkylation response protein AidB-like acyl-CoA dehydrogenase
MQWKLSEEQDAYREALRGWLGDAAGPERVREWFEAADGRGDASVFEQRFHDDGMAGVGIAEELGGQGGGLVELALTAEELARAAAPSSAWLANVLALPALDSRPDLVKAALAGAPATLLMPAERLPGVADRSVVGDAEGRVSGVLHRVLGADRAAVFVVVVAGDDGATLRLVEAQAEGVTVTPRRLLDRSRSVADVRLDKVPSEALDADVDACLDRVADLAAVLVAADALGAMQRMLDLAVEYSLQRRQFGVPIGSFQAMKHAAATILVDVEAGRSGVYFAAASVEAADDECALHAAAVKAQVTAAAARAADTALTMHGAIGYTWEHDLQLHYKRARLDEVLFGAPAAWNERIADRLPLI